MPSCELEKVLAEHALHLQADASGVDDPFANDVLPDLEEDSDEEDLNEAEVREASEGARDRKEEGARVFRTSVVTGQACSSGFRLRSNRRWS